MTNFMANLGGFPDAILSNLRMYFLCYLEIQKTKPQSEVKGDSIVQAKAPASTTTERATATEQTQSSSTGTQDQTFANQTSQAQTQSTSTTETTEQAAASYQQDTQSQASSTASTAATSALSNGKFAAYICGALILQETRINFLFKLFLRFLPSVRERAIA